MTVYVYGMRLRGFSPGCQPMDGFVGVEWGPDITYYDILMYSRILEKEELEQYGLDFLGVRDDGE